MFNFGMMHSRAYFVFGKIHRMADHPQQMVFYHIFLALSRCFAKQTLFSARGSANASSAVEKRWNLHYVCAFLRVSHAVFHAAKSRSSAYYQVFFRSIRGTILPASLYILFAGTKPRTEQSG